MRKYKKFMNEMYAEINEFVDDNHDVREELLEREKDFMLASSLGEDASTNFFDWFIFDCKSQQNGKTLFDMFLAQQKKYVSKNIYEVYSKMRNDRFSFFRVDAIKIGKQFLCTDMITNNKYQISETSLTKHINKGDYVVGRVLPFDDGFILASACVCFPKHDYDVFALFLKSLGGSDERVDAFEVYKVLFPSDSLDQLSALEKLESICQEYEINYEGILSEIQAGVRDKKVNPNKTVVSIIEGIDKPQDFDEHDFYDAFINVWNYFVDEIYQDEKKGPIEEGLVKAALGEVSSLFPYTNNLTKKEDIVYKKKVQQWMDKWFDSPLEELNNETPKQVIIKERKQLGNQQEEIEYEFNMGLSGIDLQKEDKGKKLFFAANEQMHKGEYQEAVDLYEQYCELWDENHVVWHNMSVCYVMMLKKRKAEKCLERALVIKPDYKLALDKYDELTSMYKEDMVKMVKEMLRG